MADKGVTDGLETLAPTWVYWFSLLAGFVGFLEEIKYEDPVRLKVYKFLTRCPTSALAGLLTYQVGMAMEMSHAWLIPLVGIGAHAGVETLRWLGDKWKRKFLIDADGKGKE